MGKKVDLIGQRFGRLVVIEEAGRNKRRNMLWLCKCSCGAEVTVSNGNLQSGRTKSCGCLCRELSAKRLTTHGMTKTKLFHVWHGMLTRAGSVKGADEKKKRLYQDRGISACSEWLNFQNFRDWALTHGYSDGLEIDRIDNDKGYAPENCRWVSRKENVNNRRCTIRLEDGTSLAMFCTEIGIQTRESGKKSRQYNRIFCAYRRHKIHPELLAKANEYLNTLRRLKASLDLLADIRSLEKCSVWKTSLKKT